MTFSGMPLLLRILNGFWPFEDCYLLGFVFAQFFFFLPPKAALYEDIETYISANKAPLFQPLWATQLAPTTQLSFYSVKVDNS